MGAQANQLGGRDVAFDRVCEFCCRIEGSCAGFQPRDDGRICTIGLCNDDAVGNGDLFGGLEVGVELCQAVFAIHRRDDSVELINPVDALLGHQSVHDGCGIGEPRGFQHDPADGWDIAPE